MALGYRITEPNGRVRFLQADNREEAVGLVGQVQDKWEAYCDRNWLNDTGDLFTPESKVKRLLDSLAYYLLLGYTDGIETDYRRVMHTKREIPVSSCPENYEHLLYATGGGNEDIDRAEFERFELMLDRLDQRAEKYEFPKKKRQKVESGQHKRRRLGIRDGEWLTVNTDNVFRYGDNVYVIEDQEAQYAPISTEYGDYYAMDKVLASGGKFYDMNYNEIRVQKIGTVVARELSGR